MKGKGREGKGGEEQGGEAEKEAGPQRARRQESDGLPAGGTAPRALRRPNFCFCLRSHRKKKGQLLQLQLHHHHHHPAFPALHPPVRLHIPSCPSPTIDRPATGHWHTQTKILTQTHTHTHTLSLSLSLSLCLSLSHSLSHTQAHSFIVGTSAPSCWYHVSKHPVRFLLPGARTQPRTGPGAAPGC